MEKHIIDGWAGRLERFFRQDKKEYVFIVQAAQEDHGLLRYVRHEDSWELVDRVLDNRDDWCMDAHVPTDNGMTPPGEILADWVAMELARKGWQQAALVYMVPEEEVIGYIFSLPPGLDEKQQKEAVFWELDEKLAARGLNAESFVCRCELVSSDAVSSTCSIMGVRRDCLREIKAAFAAAELRLDDVIAAREDGSGESGDRKDIQDYLSGRYPGFFPRQAHPLDWRRITACWLSGLLLLLGGWTGCDVFQYAQAKQAADLQAAELDRLSPEARQMEQAVTKIRLVEAREQLLRELQADEVPLYSVLVHFGARITEGVFITSLATDDDGRRLHLEGRAADYAVLAEFVHDLEQDRDFFTQGVILESSEVVSGEKGEAGQVKFSLWIDWESRVQDETDNGTDKGI